MDSVKYSQPFVSQLETIKDLMHGYYTSLEEHKKFTPGEFHQSITILYLRDWEVMILLLRITGKFWRVISFLLQRQFCNWLGATSSTTSDTTTIITLIIICKWKTYETRE